MTILSNWKLTYNPATTPVVVCDYDYELAEEPEFGLRIGLNVVRIPYGTPFMELTNQDVYELNLTLIRYQSDDAQARREMLETFTQRYAGLGKVPLRLEIRNLATRRFDWTTAVFHSPRVRRLTTAGGEGQAAYSIALPITAVGLTRTVIP